MWTPEMFMGLSGGGGGGGPPGPGPVTGEVNAVLPAATLIASGTHSKIISGSVNVILPATTLTASGVHNKTISGSVNATQPETTLTASGTHVHPSNFGTLVAWIDPRYNITHTGNGTPVTAWVSKDAGAYAATIAGAPTYEATGWNGQPSVVGDGVDDGAYWSSTLGSFPSGLDTPFQVVFAAQVLSATSGKCFLGFGNNANNSKFCKLETLSSNRYFMLRRDDALVQKTAASAVNDLVLNRTRLSWLFTGTTASLYKDTVLTGINGTQDLDVGTLPLDRFALFMQRGAANVGFCNVRFGPVLIYSTLTDRAGAEAWLSSQGYS
jgi:hypothetical protein